MDQTHTLDKLCSLYEEYSKYRVAHQRVDLRESQIFQLFMLETRLLDQFDNARIQSYFNFNELESKQVLDNLNRLVNQYKDIVLVNLLSRNKSQHNRINI